MAAKETRTAGAYGQDITEVENQIAADAEPLVKYAFLESDWSALDQQMKAPETFFGLPHEARLAKVRQLTGDGKIVANIISYGIEHHVKDGRVSEKEILDILADYLVKPRLERRYVDDLASYDGWRNFRNRQDLEALWGLVLKIPERLTHILLENLPLCEGQEVPSEILERMNDRQLTTLLERRDVTLTDLRRRVFLAEEETDESDFSKDGLRSAAIFVNFDPTNEEFARVLARPGKQRVRAMSSLALIAQDLRLCIYEAVHDALFASEVGLFDFQNAAFAKQSFLRRLKHLEGWRREKELLELKLYRLAVFAVPWKQAERGYPLSGELAFLNEAVVQGDTWATFTALWERWGQPRPQLPRKPADHLPRIWEAGEEESPPADQDADDVEQVAEKIASKLSDLLRAAPDKAEDNSCKASSAADSFSYHTAATERIEALEQTICHSLNSLEAGIHELRRSAYRQRLFSGTALALLLVLRFSIR